ncbi:MAG: S9 family peptidase [Flavobacteriales bacterium]
MNRILIILSIATLISSCTEPSKQTAKTNTNDTTMAKPPVAKKIPKELVMHDDMRVDDYFWMRLSDEQKNAETPDDQTQDVLDYLNAENTYKEAIMKNTEAFQEKLYEEMKGRIKEQDESVPYVSNGYQYYVRTEEGAEYPFYCRKENKDGATEQLMLDGPKLADGHDYFAIAGRAVSPNNELLAYGEDTVSRRIYSVRFKNLNTENYLEDVIEGTTGGITWANDNKTVFYAKKDPVTLRSNRIFKHVLGTPQSEDKLVFEETDETFGTFVYKTKSKKYIIVGSYSTLSNEYQFIDANTPNAEFKMIQPRTENLEYSIAHFEDNFYILTNHEAKNFRLMKAPVSSPGLADWSEVIPHREDVFLEGIELFKGWLVLDERKNGLTHLRVKPWRGDAEYYIPFEDEAYSAGTGVNMEFDTEVLRYGYTSMTTPSSTYEWNMKDRSQELLKRSEVVGGHNPEDYTSKRLYATARDGVKVPISLVYKKGVELDGTNPTLLYAYGSYGSTIDPGFSSLRLTLLNRGFVFAIAHIRGGQVMGREWYEDGKMLKKMNTFTDYIDCAKFLMDEKYTNSDHLYAQGGSAGGLLMGAVINMQPDYFNGVIAAVPFVDVVSTMLDESIPLTTGEFDEWGNPKEKRYYDYMKSYSPYDNIIKQDYPNMLITTGYWDSQVQYWEPAKWLAKLREYKTDDNILIMDCNMDTGHGGASGRFAALKEYALEYAFFLKLEGITE